MITFDCFPATSHEKGEMLQDLNEVKPTIPTLADHVKG